MIPAKNRLKIGEFFGKDAPRPEKVIKNSYFSLKIFRTSAKYPRFGVAVGGTLDKRASARVRLKRIIFEFFRLNVTRFSPADYILSPSKNMTTLDKKEIIKILSEAARR